MNTTGIDFENKYGKDYKLDVASAVKGYESFKKLMDIPDNYFDKVGNVFSGVEVEDEIKTYSDDI